MSVFWHRRADEPVAQLWRRCDLCRWSGPNPRFTLWTNERGEYCSTCDHDWCKSPLSQHVLVANGWWVTSEPEAG